MCEPPKIQKLEEAVINRIAAGEVIQRPVNAIKEMIENSIDARSTNIQVTVKQGGLKYIQIQDNGSGIRKEDFEIVCERFTTSKLREFEDLNTIATYGFRGEALASISHIAHLTIQSKTENEKCAYRASFVDGKLQEGPKAVAGVQGTQIVVEDLFYNMNVRRAAMKNGGEEYQRIIDVVGKYAVHNSSIGFGLKKFNENNDIRTPQNSNAIDNIRSIYGNLIARELINFNVDNDELKFKAHGYMTNVNYSTKKFIFLLFINNRLVDCTGLKKCIDQVFSTYLPKHMHPFVYLSLDLDPRTIDVNVHPTKHEVHFLNEEQIIESLTATLETKLLGSNNSRVFFVQTKLPGAIVSDAKESGAIRTYDKDLVRTDFAEQKLDKFVVPPDLNRSGANPDDSALFKRDNELFLDQAADFEHALNRSICLRSSLTKIQNECKLTSVLHLRREIEGQCHKTLRELFAQHVFVGCVNTQHSLVQHGTKLYLCDTTRIMEEVFYELVLYNFQNFGTIKLSDPSSLKELARLALDLAETGWTEQDGDKEELAEKVQEILTEKGEMLKTYFSIDVDEFGYLKSLPLLLDNHLPEVGYLPMYVLQLATEVDWEHEKRCFGQLARETGIYYAKMYESDVQSSDSWKWMVEHVFYPAIKDFFLPPKTFTENAAVLQIADLPHLYKVFERC